MTQWTNYSTIYGMDPHVSWLLGPGYRDFMRSEKDAPVPLLLELSNPAAIAAFNAAANMGTNMQQALVPRLENEDVNKLFEPGRARLVFVMQAWLEKVAKADTGTAEARFRDAKKSISLSSPVLLPDNVSFPPFKDYKIKTTAALQNLQVPDDAVVMVVIDDGIAFAHERFRLSDGSTRLLCFWDMDHPGTWGTGMIHTRDAINGHIASATRNDVIDEDNVYRDAQYIVQGDGRRKTAALRTAHGTHVADLAAGEDPSMDETKRPIIAIQLPTEVIQTTSGSLLDAFVGGAMTVAVLLARILAPNNRIVFSVSLGYFAGSHDGNGPLERSMENISSLPDGILFALPSGNNQLSQGYAEIDLTGSNLEVEFDLQVQPDDRTVSTVEIWLPKGAGPPANSRMEVTVVAPNGIDNMILGETPGVKFLPAGAAQPGDRFAQLDYAFDQNRQRSRFVLWLAPTARLQPDNRVTAPSGQWHLRFLKQKPIVKLVHAWVQRDDRIYGYPLLGRQSYFEHRDYQRFDQQGFPLADDPPMGNSPVQRKSLVNAIATSRSVVTVGGYREKDGTLVDYSSGGPTTPPENAHKRKPDAALPTEAGLAHFGVLAAGSRSGARTILNGTSVAAPHAARFMAKLIQLGNNPNRQSIKDQALFDPSPSLPNNRQGWGRIKPAVAGYVLNVKRIDN